MKDVSVRFAAIYGQSIHEYMSYVWPTAQLKSGV